MKIKMGKILEYLLREDVIVVFDVDGVLAAYEFGELCHNQCTDGEWEDFVKQNRPYDRAKAIPQIKKFIKDKGVKNVYTCSVSAPFEEENKKNFIIREYNISEENIIFVRDSKDKLLFLRELAKKGNPEEKIALVEDTVSTLNSIFDQSDFITVHVSSFFFY